MHIAQILSLTLLLTSCNLNGNRANQSTEYGYIFEESTGQNEYILVGSRKSPITFSSGSNTMALQSLRALKASVLYGNCDGSHMFVTGEYDADSHTYRLDRWYITVPFVEYAVENETLVPQVIHKLSRSSLEKSDFVEKNGFDPSNPSFDPRQFERFSPSQKQQ